MGPSQPAFGSLQAHAPPAPRATWMTAGTLSGLHAMRVRAPRDVFRKWDHDMDQSVSSSELRRALAALSIPIDERALRLLFSTLDVDASGALSFKELNAALQRKVDFAVAGGERFDADTKTYTTAHTHVKQRVAKANAQTQGRLTSSTPCLPALSAGGFHTTASISVLEPQFVSVLPEAAQAAEKHHAQRHRREAREGQTRDRELRAAHTRMAHDTAGA